MESDEVRVFDFCLRRDPEEVAILWAFLDEGERDRASCFATLELKRNYVVAHGAMRAILAGLLGPPPAKLQFIRTDEGRPACVDLASAGFDFNLTHTGDRALLAVARHRRVGVDLERLRQVPDALAISRRNFHPVEIRHLEGQDEAVRSAAFLALWTKKESYVKARGGGLFMAMDTFYEGSAGASFCRWFTGENVAAPWFVAPVAVGEDHVAAVTFSE